MRKSPSTITERHRRRLVNTAVRRQLSLQTKYPVHTESSSDLNLNSSVEENSESFQPCVPQSNKLVSTINQDYLLTEYLPLSDQSSESDCSTHNENVHSTINIRRQLQLWGVRHQITHSALSDLLKVLKGHQCFETLLPVDPRTLLKTPRSTQTRSIGQGTYVHLGFQHSLNSFFHSSETLPDYIKVQINIDGLPLSKSSNKQFWPILGYIVNSIYPVFAVGIFYGDQKPSSVSDFLSEFIEEAKELCENGFTYKNKNIKFYISAFVCDAPARAYILQVKNHTGYYGCSKCVVKGKYIENRVVYLKTTANLRTNKSFRAKENPKHHLSSSPLETLDINMVDDIPYEYMHLVCLGVMRKLILLWTKGKRRTFKLSQKDVKLIDESLSSVRKIVPKEFTRKPRSVREVEKWKATELRQFLLYTGPFVMQKILPSVHYDLFLHLHISIRILCTPILCYSENELAQTHIKQFVKGFQSLYGKEHSSYNVHGLLHLPKDVIHHGNADSFSAFRFEDYLGKLKRLLRDPNQPIQQIHRRIIELDECILTSGNKNPSNPAQLRIQHLTGMYPRHLSVSSEYMCANYKNFF